MKKYLPRLIENVIQREMAAVGCVAIEGPKWCGKSTTAERFAKTVVKLQDPIVFRQYEGLAATSRQHLLAGEKPLMFDEWQKIPELWDFIRANIDEIGGQGQYILTGSARPSDDEKRHSGTGRIAKATMRPMSLWESGDSTGEVSLNDLFDGKDDVYGKARLGLDDLAFVTCRGGWPENVIRPKQAMVLMNDYFKSLVSSDITGVDGIKRNPKRAAAILRSYARNISTFAANTTILDDIASNDASMDNKTFCSYITALEKLFVIENVSAWSPRLRSKSVIRATDKRQFVDPSVAVAALNASPKDLVHDLNTFGLFFESLCDRDLRVYSESINGELYHYRDGDGLEADAIVHLHDGRWGAIEVKVGGNLIDEAAKNLLKLKAKVDSEKMSQPSFLMVLTGVQTAYKRQDGVLVVPVGCLKN